MRVNSSTYDEESQEFVTIFSSEFNKRSFYPSQDIDTTVVLV